MICGVVIVGCSKFSGGKKKNLIPRADANGLQGVAAPDFTLNDLQGHPFKLSDQKGKVVFLDFWATWCPPCRMSIPELMKLHEAYSGKDVEIVSISLDDNPRKVLQFVTENNIKHTQLFAGDSQVERIYGVRGIPTFVVIDKEGKIAHMWTGFDPSMPDDWRSELDRLLKA